jgi:ABC-type oligopeptide transport system ATPase subunit
MNVLEVSEVRKYFPVQVPGGSLFDRLRARTRHRPLLHAVDDVSFTINRGESLGLVG